MFRKILLEKDFEDYIPKELDNLSKVNLFVGENNSGKSRFIRRLFQSDDIKFIPEDLDFKLINEITDTFYYNLRAFFTNNKIKKYGNVIETILNYKPLKFITSSFSPDLAVFGPYLSITNTGNNVGLDANKTNMRTDISIMIENEYNGTFSKLNNALPSKYSYKYGSLYIPSIRGLRNVVKDSEIDHYKERTLLDYFSKETETIKNRIYTGLTFYKELKRQLLGKHEERLKVNKFEVFLSKNFFSGESVHLIPNIDDDVVYIKIGEDEDYPIYNLGDGIQMIIILTYPLFFSDESNLKVYIEEPELFLHPGMQRILLDTFTDPLLFPSHQFFIATHSNHLLDMTADFGSISIFTLIKNKFSKVIELNNVENGDSDILNLLGVKNASVFLSNCTIWVEGITDRLYIRKYIQVYLRDIGDETIKEDIHYSFVEYGGGNITHWSFLDDKDSNFPNINVKNLCGKLFLISDRDGAGLKIDGSLNSRMKKKYERHQKLTDKLNERYYCLKSREIENTLSPEVLKATINKFEKGNAKNIIFNNWSIDKYKNKKIGNFINSNVIKKSRNYSTASGTINEKLKFTKLAVTSINSILDLSEEAKELTTKIYNFIKEQNSTYP